MMRLKINDVANEIIHASQMMFVNDEEIIPTGLLIASDWHLRAPHRPAAFRATLADGSRPKQTDLIPDKGQFS